MPLMLQGEWKELSEYCGLTSNDLEILHQYASHFEKCAAEIVDEFYAEMEKQPFLMRILLAHSTIDRLKQTQVKYFLSLTSNRIDDAYIAGRQQIGVVHAHIGLTPQWFLAAYMTYVQILYKRIMELPDGGSLFLAFFKRLFFDSIVILKQYGNIVEHLQFRSTIEELSGEISNSLTRISSIASQYSSSAQSLAESQEQIAISMKRLKESGKKIERLSGFVLEIADKTHLLGLNAAIEAARAGEHGRGFSIVAGEVRKLAADSKQSSKEIRSVITDIVTQLHLVDEQVEQTKAISDEQAAFAEELSSHIQNVKRVSENMHERVRSRSGNMEKMVAN